MGEFSLEAPKIIWLWGKLSREKMEGLSCVFEAKGEEGEGTFRLLNKQYLWTLASVAIVP